jgi:hypothetical protein
MLTRISGPKREEVTGGWRTVHNEELHNLYASPNINRMITSRRMKMDETCSTHGRNEKYNILDRKPEGKRPLGRPRH